MALEREIRGFINSKSDFEFFIKTFQSQDYKYKFVQRLSIVAGDYLQRDLETRLRISNGKITLVQKKGDIGATSRDEIEMELDLNAEQFKELALMINNLSLKISDSYCFLARHDNHIFKSNNMEIKLFKQYAKGEFYGYEVEINDISENELEKTVKDLGFEIDKNFDEDSIVRHRNSEINYPLGEIKEKELLDIIRLYY